MTVYTGLHFDVSLLPKQLLFTFAYQLRYSLLLTKYVYLMNFQTLVWSCLCLGCFSWVLETSWALCLSLSRLSLLAPSSSQAVSFLLPCKCLWITASNISGPRCLSTIWTLPLKTLLTQPHSAAILWLVSQVCPQPQACWGLPKTPFSSVGTRECRED